MVLMGKSKNPTPQELYRARKQREEDERDAFLPPGLINHGNTCFMNSVLQGLFATPLLVDIIQFSLPPSASPILSRRSPQLTNGHAYGGDSQREREDGMPLGDVFVTLMEKAWEMQEERKRDTMSPKDILTRLGAKYDQYLDFRQQDAHELLRHLLDAMRMEEFDVIKKRQPKVTEAKRKKKRVEADLASSVASMPPDMPYTDTIPEEERLTSFVDMVFGGRLASILVCDKCKKISCTYEDFNDISLSIRAEDYEKARKRDRLRNFAHRLGMRGRTHARDQAESSPRASSVPASPTTTGRPSDVEHSLDQVMTDDGQRRRSIDADSVPVPGEGISSNDEVARSRAEDDRKALRMVEEHVSWQNDVRNEDGPQHEKDEDSWIKLRRRISVSMRKTSGKKRKSKSKEPPPPLPPTQRDQSSAEDALKDDIDDSFVDVKIPTAASAATSPNSSPALGGAIALPKFSFARRPSPSRKNSASPAPSPSMSPRLSPIVVPPLPRLDSNTRIPTRTALSSGARGRNQSSQPAKVVQPPKPPKMSRAESAYLRRLLADIPSASSAPFNLFRGNSSTSIHELADVRTYLNGIGKMGMGLGGQAQTLEECLRMFTSVEVLDGENMVGCHRCWKIERGEYVPRGSAAKGVSREGKESVNNREAEENSDKECDEDDSDVSSSSQSSAVKITTVDTEEDEPVSVKAGSPPGSSLDLDDAASAPPRLRSNTSAGIDSGRVGSDLGLTSTKPNVGSAPALVSVPSISMTAPDTVIPVSQQGGIGGTAQIAAESGVGVVLTANISRDSLHIPISRPHGHSRTPAERASVASNGTEADASSLSSVGSEDEDDDQSDSDTEPTEALNSDSSSYRSARAAIAQHPSPSLEATSMGGTTLSPSISPSQAIPSSDGSIPGRPSTNTATSIPRSKRVVMRRAYKRYLIATPPPVLVVHLKRFQQVGRTPTFSMQHQFFSNFKKLDDPVGVPEYLDLQPYLLPKKSEFFSNGEKSRKGEKEKVKSQERCMYRLYAVVVHIGNMLGGHYIAYTALPEAAPTSPINSLSSEKLTESDSATSTQPSSVAKTEAGAPGQCIASPRSVAFVHSANPNMRSSPTVAEGTSSGASTSPPPPGTAGSTASTATATAESFSTPTSPTRRWCYVSDTVVRLATLEEVLKAKAYICMYERV